MTFALPKSATVHDDFELISADDPAVDKSADDFDDQWQRYLEGTQAPPLKEGETPVLWRLRHMRSARVRAKFEDEATQHGIGSARLFLARYALRGVKNLRDTDGNPVALKFDSGLFELVSMDFMDQLNELRCNGGPDLVHEISEWAVQSNSPS